MITFDPELDVSAICRAMRDKSISPVIERMEGNLRIVRRSVLLDSETILTPLREEF